MPLLPNEPSIMRLIGAVLFEQNDDWQSQHRSMMVEAVSQIESAQIDPIPGIPTQAASPMIRDGHPTDYTSLTHDTRRRLRFRSGTGREA
jgi:hypothetical protein